MPNPTPQTETAERLCECFGDSGLQASTHESDGRECCDLCGRPVQPHPETAERGAHTPEAVTLSDGDLLAARAAIRRGAPEGQSVPRCSCFDGSRAYPDPACAGVCMDAARNVAQAIAARRTAMRERIAAEARRYASHYPQSSDGRNTLIMLAEWVEALDAGAGV